MFLSNHFVDNTLSDHIILLSHDGMIQIVQK